MNNYFAITVRFSKALKLIVTTVFLTASSSLSYGQALYSDCNNCSEIIISEQAIAFAKKFTPKPPFSQKQFYNNWTRGYIEYNNGDRATGILLAYNGWIDELLWLREKDFQSAVVAKDNIAEFRIVGDNYQLNEVFRKVWVGGLTSSHVFLHVLAEGDEITLYCHRKVSYLVSKQEFVNSFAYYAYFNGQLRSFRSNWISVVLMFPKEERANIKQIIRTNHLKVREEKDLIKLFTILNQEGILAEGK